VKDINSVYESLQTLITGEVISDFKCEGCDKKVDITKRTLISQTPNVLIVHLQRLLFDFDTFRNEKNNEHFAFPNTLDLKDYTYHEVMKRENRVPKEKGSDDEDQEPEVKEDGDDQVPEEDDCFEYKLVGVNVHSGTANAGHYWSYINTERGMEEKDSQDPTWAETETEQWMEFNDSTVKDYKFENLKDECFGEK
jgi:ubiquitin carboxyl-terminal hydrolase 34